MFLNSNMPKDEVGETDIAPPFLHIGSNLQEMLESI